LFPSTLTKAPKIQGNCFIKCMNFILTQQVLSILLFPKYATMYKVLVVQMGGIQMAIVRTKDLLDNFNLTLVAGKDGIHREITTSDISRPGIEMTGYFNYYPKERLQLIGKTEMAYFLDLDEEQQYIRADRLCTEDRKSTRLNSSHVSISYA